MARLWRVAHFVLSDFLALSLDQMPAGKTAYPEGIPPAAPSASTAALDLGRHGSQQPVSPAASCNKFSAFADFRKEVSQACYSRHVYMPTSALHLFECSCGSASMPLCGRRLSHALLHGFAIPKNLSMGSCYRLRAAAMASRP